MAEPSPEQIAALTALIEAETRAYNTAEERILAAVRRLFRATAGQWFDPATMRRVAADAAEIVRAGQETIAGITENYLADAFDLMEIRVTDRAAANRSVSLPDTLRVNVDPIQEWERPGRDARVGMLLGIDEFEANEKALLRAERQARMDAALARREAEKQRWGVSDEIIGFRRILHPELTQEGPCGLCVVAADRIYSIGILRPLHNGCVCTALPVTRTNDPGRTMNRDELDAIYEAAGGTGRQGLQRVRMQQLEHGELGPILVDRRHKNTTPKQADERKDAGLDPDKVIDAQRRIIDKLEADLEAGREVNQKTLDQHRKWLAEWLDKKDAA